MGQSKTILNPRQEAFNIRKTGMHSQVETQLQTVNPRSGLEAMMRPMNSSSSTSDPRGQKRKHDEIEDDDEDDDQAHDEVRLWEDGFKDRYYESKFDIAPDNLEFRFVNDLYLFVFYLKNVNFRYAVALHYVRGLCWVLRYYYQGCASWKWYFPYHYAPFASDFINIAGLSTEFEHDTKPVIYFF